MLTVCTTHLGFAIETYPTPITQNFVVSNWDFPTPWLDASVMICHDDKKPEKFMNYDERLYLRKTGSEMM